jgi:hypothetical protein
MLFGWDYVYWNNSATQGTSRVRTDYLGNPYYIWSLDVRVKITNPDNVMWLTCHPDKYFDPNYGKTLKEDISKSESIIKEIEQ